MQGLGSHKHNEAVEGLLSACTKHRICRRFGVHDNVGGMRKPWWNSPLPLGRQVTLVQSDYIGYASAPIVMEAKRLRHLPLLKMLATLSVTIISQ